MTDGVPAAAGLMNKGWSAARRVSVEADTERLRAMIPGDGIAVFLALAKLAQQLAPGAFGEDDHLAALSAVATVLRRTCTI